MRFILTAHAIQRYVERVKPGLDHEAARAELEALVEAAPEPSSKPSWLYLPEEATEAAEHYLMLSDGIAAPIRDGNVVVAVICRAGSNDEHRRNKNRLKADRRKRRKKLPFKPGRGKEAGVRWR